MRLSDLLMIRISSVAMTNDTRSLRDIARDSLDSTECPHCHNSKESGQSFCRRCYFALPKNLRMALYKTFSEGYVDHWDEAREWLKGNL